MYEHLRLFLAGMEAGVEFDLPYLILLPPPPFGALQFPHSLVYKTS